MAKNQERRGLLKSDESFMAPDFKLIDQGTAIELGTSGMCQFYFKLRYKLIPYMRAMVPEYQDDPEKETVYRVSVETHDDDEFKLTIS